MSFLPNAINKLDKIRDLTINLYKSGLGSTNIKQICDSIKNLTSIRKLNLNFGKNNIVGLGSEHINFSV